MLFDPWFRPWHDADPPGYRPLLPRDMGRLDAIFITHAHGDHFHLGSLVHFPRKTKVFVPRVEKDTLLAHDLRPFLRAVGFTRARAIGWGEQVRVGDLAVQALPFYGEQPTAGAVCYPDVRNVGNTYAARGPGVSAAFLADSGRDALGDMRDVGLAARPVGWLFTGCRAFALYPLLVMTALIGLNALLRCLRRLVRTVDNVKHDEIDLLDLELSRRQR